jgi:alpha-L-arabinofuranosidase
MLNLQNWEWSPTTIEFTADPSQTTRSTSWHVIQVRICPPFLSSFPKEEEC